FVRDTLWNTTTAVTRLDVGGGGGQPSISADGRYVAFSSGDSTLVPGDTNGQTDVFVRDRSTGSVSRVSVDSSGNQADLRSDSPSISPDGRWTVFESQATNLVAGDTNGTWDVFVHDSVTGATTRLSVAADGTQGNGDSTTAVVRAHFISADGRYVGTPTTTWMCSSTT
ncbi:MAG: hypothetical protein E6G44_11140, partial [Actinobacteria bacterium]